ncbi:nuclear transport factor 2 family protein [Novosphingobium resinovorum]|uniref:YybH family protein n=1 Tax=Novosphingobium resinovorum TaxID=158500 RepID=UPI002ED13171|nr:nuclear transport factor 2 family protein [Novosphingobium resinovorum]
MNAAQEEIAIRARRADFNRAIEQGDASAIGPLLARDCIMVTGTDSAVIAGRMAQVKVWRREFAHAGRWVYVRRPETVLLSRVEPIAMEHGTWHGMAPDDAAPSASGSYFAKWRKLAQEWVIEAEVFVTLA